MKTFRRVFVVLLVLGAAQNADAQENLMAMLRSDLRADAQQIMTFAMELSNDEATNFWPSYREYERARSRWGDRRVALIRRFSEQYETMSDDTAAGLAEEMFALLGDRLKLLEEFYYRFAAGVSPSVGARFVQVERQLNMIMDLQIAQQMPLVFTMEHR